MEHNRMLGIPTLPEAPPELDKSIKLSAAQVKKAKAALEALSASLENLPVVLSQDGKVVTSAGAASEAIIERIAKVAGRIWNDGKDRLARELIRFEEESIEAEDADKRANVMIYSAHISGALTLSLGWQMTISLTQIRAEVGDARSELQNILNA